MIEGAFDHLFDLSPVHFNSEQGTFSFRSENKGSIYLKGDGNRRHWTEKAIIRAGFSVSDVKTIPYIIVPAENDSRWILVSNTSTQAAGSIYELVNLLASGDIHPI